MLLSACCLLPAACSCLLPFFLKNDFLFSLSFFLETRGAKGATVLSTL